LISIRKTCNKIFSAFENKQKLQNCKKKSAKSMLRPLAPRRPWHQVVPDHSQHQAVQRQVGCIRLFECVIGSGFHKDVISCRSSGIE